jgi:hypothetical protein
MRQDDSHLDRRAAAHHHEFDIENSSMHLPVNISVQRCQVCARALGNNVPYV